MSANKKTKKKARRLTLDQALNEVRNEVHTSNRLQPDSPAATPPWQAENVRKANLLEIVEEKQRELRNATLHEHDVERMAISAMRERTAAERELDKALHNLEAYVRKLTA